MNALPRFVIPAKAGIQSLWQSTQQHWTPASAGMTAICLAIVASGVSPWLSAQDAPSQRDLQPRPAEIAPLAAKSLLLGLASADGKLVAVGDRGTILLSADGKTWQQSPSPVHATLTAVAFADARHGWAAGHDATILRSVDGGQNWTLQNFQPADSKPVLALMAVDAQRAYAVGAYGMFLSTGDGGANWTPLDAPELLADGLHLYTLIRLNSGELFAAGETGLAGVSADGIKWQRLTVPYEGSLFGALPRGEKGALVFGLRGNVLITDDVHSKQWTVVDTGTVHSLFGGALLPEGAAVLVGADGALLRITPDGKAERLDSAADFGTLSAVLPWNGQWLAVGELGANTVTK